MKEKLTAEILAKSVAGIVPFILRGVHLDFVGSSPITHTQFLVLVAAFSYDEATMKRLSDTLHVSMPTMTGIVDRLCKGGYLKRYQTSEDRRKVCIELTEKGKNFIRDFQKTVGRRWAEVLRGFDQEDLARFDLVLKKLHGAIAART